MHARTERRVLSEVRHPFIVRLFWAFQTPQRVYLVMEFVQGGDFYTLMRCVTKGKTLPATSTHAAPLLQAPLRRSRHGPDYNQPRCLLAPPCFIPP